MSTIPASEFKAKCFAWMDRVTATGETIVVTRNGRPVAELRPHRPPRVNTLIGLRRCKLGMLGDSVSRLTRCGKR